MSVGMTHFRAFDRGYIAISTVLKYDGWQQMSLLAVDQSLRNSGEHNVKS
jgi:hypothetical protein